MTYSPRIRVYLIVITSRETLVSKEVDGGEVDSRYIFLGLDMLQAIGLVPPGWENVEGNLATDRVSIWLLCC